MRRIFRRNRFPRPPSAPALLAYLFAWATGCAGCSHTPIAAMALSPAGHGAAKQPMRRPAWQAWQLAPQPLHCADAERGIACAGRQPDKLAEQLLTAAGGVPEPLVVDNIDSEP